MNKKFMIGGCAAIAVAGNVFAADESISYFNPYASLKGGYAFLGKRNDIKYKGGFAGAVELGVSYDAWRLGLELGYKQNKVKEITKGDVDTSTWTTTNTDAIAFCNHSFMAPYKDGEGHYDVHFVKFDRISALTGMVNVFYDYPMTEAWSLYAGVGLGVARVSYRVNEVAHAKADSLDANTIKTAFDQTNTNFKKLLWSDIKTEISKTVFAWQLMAGVGYEFNENWKLTLGYKLFNTAKVKVFGDKKIKTPFNHTAELGLTYTF